MCGVRWEAVFDRWKPSTIGALIITSTILGVPFINVVYWAPKPYSNI